MSKKAGVRLMILGTVLILAALSLVVYNRCQEAAAAHAAEQILDRLETITGSQVHVTATPLPDVLPETEIDGNHYIGYLRIPSLELELPVMADWSYPQLRVAPCRYYGDLRSGMVIAAHNYERHFGRIRQLQPGEAVYFVDMNGRAYRYEVAEVEVLAPTAIEEMVSADWDLTLFTCTYGGKTRVTVRCVSTPNA